MTMSKQKEGQSARKEEQPNILTEDLITCAHGRAFRKNPQGLWYGQCPECAESSKKFYLLIGALP